MLSISFYTASLAVLQIFAMCLVGYLLVRRQVIDEKGLGLLTFLSVNIFFPFFIFNQILTHFTPHTMPYWWGFPLINMSLIVLGLIISSLALRGKGLRNEILATTSFHNAGYIPVLLVMTLPLGKEAGAIYSAVIIAIVGFDLCLWSLGVWLLTRSKEPRINFLKVLNPPLLSMVAAITLVLLGQEKLLAGDWLKPVKIIGDAAMAVGMIVIGGNLALTSLRKIYVKEVAGVVLFKLILMPLLALVVILMFKLPAMVSLILLVQSSMPTAMTLSVIGRYYGVEQQSFINQVIFFTHLVSIITIPVFLGLYGRISG